MMLVAPLGTVLRLTQDWSFKLKSEHRNSQLAESLGFMEDASFEKTDGSIHHYKRRIPGVATLPAGTILKLDRIYVKKGAGDYNSLTFWIVPKDRKDKLRGRFFAALADCNQLEYEVLT